MMPTANWQAAAARSWQQAASAPCQTMPCSHSHSMVPPTTPARASPAYCRRRAAPRSPYPPTPQEAFSASSPPPRTGRPDWKCITCGNNNFGFRSQCNQCATPQPGKRVDPFTVMLMRVPCPVSAADVAASLRMFGELAPVDGIKFLQQAAKCRQWGPRIPPNGGVLVVHAFCKFVHPQSAKAVLERGEVAILGERVHVNPAFTQYPNDAPAELVATTGYAKMTLPTAPPFMPPPVPPPSAALAFERYVRVETAKAKLLTREQETASPVAVHALQQQVAALTAAISQLASPPSPPVISPNAPSPRAHGVGEALCAVCKEEPRDHLLAPCGHKIVCAGCAHSLVKDRAGCPCCRAVISQIYRVVE